MAAGTKTVVTKVVGDSEIVIGVKSKSNRIFC